MTDKQDTKEEIRAVGPGADEDDAAATPLVDTRAGDDYQYPEGDEDGDEARAAGDERAGHSAEDQDDEAGLTRQQRKRRHQREKQRSEQRELAFLRARNEQLERQRSQDLARIENRQTQNDVITIDGRISQAENDIREAETLYAQARRANDPDAEIEALRVRDQLRDGLRQLQTAKQQTVRSAQERQNAATQPTAPDPAVAARTQEWVREHPWVQERGEAALIASAVETQLFNEGRLDPRSDDYWDEVDRRLAKRLPEHYRNGGPGDDEDDDEDDDIRDTLRRRVNGNGNGEKRRPSGPTIKVGGRERTLRKGEVFIDEDRKNAMIEAGVWDDPKARERFLKAYQTYDREAGRRPR